MTRTSHKVLYRGIKSTAEAHKQGRTAAAAPAHFETVMSLVIFLKWIKEGEITLSLFQPTRTIYLIIVFKSYLIGCSVSIERNAHLVVALVLAGESDAGSQRYLHSSQRVTEPVMSV